MARTKSIAPEETRNMEDAWLEGGEKAVTRAAIVKYARTIDVTESGRDMKPLITGMFDAIDRLKALEARDEEGTGRTPLNDAIDLAETS